MLRQLLVGTAVSVCNIAIHALVMATVVQISSRVHSLMPPPGLRT
jgi:hypothetical protein